MRRRLFLRAGSAASLAALAACGGGGGDLTAPSQLALEQSDPAPKPSSSPAADASSEPATQPAQQDQPVASSSGLPTKVLGCYYTLWDTSRLKITDIPTDFNVIYLFHACPQGSGSNRNNMGDGSFQFDYYANVRVEDIQAVRRRGQKVILTVGGAHNGYAWDNRTKSRNFVESVKTMYARLGGFDGLDFNNFEATIISSANVAVVTAEMVWIAGQLKAMYGQQFAITAPPQPTSPEQKHLMLSMAKAGVLDYAGPQYYDWSGFNAPGFIKGRTDEWVAMMGDAQKVVVGFSGNYPNGPSLEDCVREWKAIRAAHPQIRGMFCWSAQHVMAGGNVWGTSMKALM